MAKESNDHLGRGIGFKEIDLFGMNTMMEMVDRVLEEDNLNYIVENFSNNNGHVCKSSFKAGMFQLASIMNNASKDAADLIKEEKKKNPS